MVTRKIDAKLLAQLSETSKTQEIGAANARSEDPNFPILTAQVDKQLLVYIPKVCESVRDNQPVFDPVTAYQHTISTGNKRTQRKRCYQGFVNEELGYDGTCPACDAINECWESFNTKVDSFCHQNGINRQTDPENAVLKEFSRKLIEEMPVQKVKKYVTFPAIVLNDTCKIPATQEDAANFKGYFVDMYYDTFEEKVITPMSGSQLGGTAATANPAGKFFIFNYKYALKPGEVADKMTAGKKLVISQITDAGCLQQLNAFVPFLEQVGAAFTNLKAVDVIKAYQFEYAEDYKVTIDKLMGSTRAFNASANVNLLQPVNPIATNMNAALATFGVQPQNVAPMQPQNVAPMQPQNVAPMQSQNVAPMQSTPTMTQPAGFGVQPNMLQPQVTNPAFGIPSGAMGVTGA